MEEKFIFTNEERKETLHIIGQLKRLIGDTLLAGDEERLREYLKRSIDKNLIQRDVFGLNPILLGMQTTLISVEEIGLKRDGVLAILLYTGVISGSSSVEEVSRSFGESVAHIIQGLVRIHDLYKRTPLKVRTSEICCCHLPKTCA